MEQQQLQTTFPKVEQVIRETATRFILNKDVTMEITTFARVYPGYVTNVNSFITFHLKEDNVAVKSGPVHHMLLEKYFKPTMIQW